LRPSGLEVADIFRHFGPAYRDEHAELRISAHRGHRFSLIVDGIVRHPMRGQKDDSRSHLDSGLDAFAIGQHPQA
jgi:hypothetical protein